MIGNLTGITTGAYGWVGSIISSLLFFAIPIFLIVLSVKNHRDKESGGYITIGRVILIGLVVTFISMAISHIFNYIYMNFIDPGFLETTLVNVEEMLDGVVPEEDLEQILIDTKGRFETSSLIKSFFIIVAVFGLVVSSIVGLIMKKDPPRV